MPRRQSLRPWVAVVWIALWTNACATVGQTCSVDSDCNDPNQQCVFNDSSTTVGVCTPKASSDGGPARDGGTRLDGGTHTDGGSSSDGGPARDGGSGPDGGPIADGGQVQDGGATVDGGSAHDGGPATDGGAQDGGSAADGGSAQDGGSTADGGSAFDGGSADAGTSLSETEPNNTQGTANDFTTSPLPLSVAGTVSSGTDVDYFRFHGAAGSLLRITVAPGASSALDPRFVVRGADPANRHLFRIGSKGSGASATRQVFLPVDGNYLVAVADGSGGAGGAYTLTIAPESIPSPTAVAVGSATNGSITTGQIDFYNVTPSAGPVRASAVAKALATPSNVDTLVTIWDPTAGKVIAEVDDSDTPTGTVAFSTDARVAWQAAGNKTYQVLVDHVVIESPGTNTTYELDIAIVGAEGASATDLNDRFSTSYPLAVGQAPFGGTMRPTSSIDWDVYQVYLHYNDTITVTGNGAVNVGAENWTYFAVTDELGSTRRLGLVDNNYQAVSTFYVGTTGTYYLWVTDYRYLLPPPADGGTSNGDPAGTAYTIGLAPGTAPSVQSLSTASTSSSISAANRGMSSWYEVNHTGGVLFAKVVAGDANIIPAVTIWSDSGGALAQPVFPYAGFTSDVVVAAGGDASLDLPAGKYIVEVNDLYGFYGAFMLNLESPAVTSTPTVGAPTLIFESDTSSSSTTNDTCAAANALGGVPSVGIGNLTGGDVDFYKFAATGTSAVIRTAAAGADFVDTALELWDSAADGGAPLFSNDDENASAGQFYSKITASGLTVGHTYCIKVTGKRSTDFGLYAVVVTAQ
jgi:hypothetical protein